VWSAGILIITDEQVNIALKNGLSRDTVRNRVYSLKWDVERAISTPIRPRPIIIHTEHDIDDAKKKGIGFNTFYGRVVTYKWSVDRAKNEPPRRQDGIKKKKGDKYAMDWNQKIDALKRDLDVMEKWISDNYKSIPTPLLKPIDETVLAMIRQIKRLEINAKDYDES
jgi:hypothetical protein